jgi:hypothetical protein
MNERLIVGVLAIVVGFLGIAICYLGARNPREPKWTGEMIMGSFLIPLFMGSGILGLMLSIDGLIKGTASLGAADIAVALGILAAGLAVFLLLGIKKRVAAYDALRNTSEIIALQQMRRAADTADTSTRPLDHAA